MATTRMEPSSYRIERHLHDRMLGGIAGSGNDYSKSEIVNRALECFFALLDINPSMLPGYNPDEDPSVTQEKNV